MARETKSHRSSRAREPTHILLVAGIPTNCKWQDFKDEVRPMVEGHIGNTDTYKTDDGQTIGFAVIPDKKAAYEAHATISKKGMYGRTVTVGLATQTGPNQPLKRVADIKQSLPHPSTANLGHAPHHYNTSPTSTGSASPAVLPLSLHQQTGYGQLSHSTTPMYSPTVVSYTDYRDIHVPITPEIIAMACGMFNFIAAPITPQPYNRHAVIPANQPVYNTAAYANHRHAAPVIRRDSMGPVVTAPIMTMTNVSRHQAPPIIQTIVRTPAPPPPPPPPPQLNTTGLNRSVHLTGLPWEITDDRLRQILRQFGPVEECRVLWDRRKNRGKGTATATFGTHEDAATAIRGLNERDIAWMGTPRKAFVKWDKESLEGVVIRGEVSGTRTSKRHEATEESNRRSGERGEGKGRHERREESRGERRRDGRRDTPKEKGRKRDATHTNDGYEGPVIVNGDRGRYRGGSSSDSDSDESSDGKSHGGAGLSSRHSHFRR